MVRAAITLEEVGPLGVLLAPLLESESDYDLYCGFLSIA